MQSNLREYDLGQVNEMYKIKINTRASIQWPLLKVIEWVIVDNHQEKIIVSIVGDTNEIKEWIHTNQEKILNEQLPFNTKLQGSIAEKIDFFYKNINLNEDKLVDAMFEYRLSHGIRFAHRGTDTPQIYIGKNNNYHEVSCLNEKGGWSYNFNANDLIESILDLE